MNKESSLPVEPPVAGVSIVVPTYKEALCVEELLQRLARAGRRLVVPFEVLIVDDDSPDGTAELAEGFASRSRASFPLRVLRRSGRRSLALSVLEGAAAACYRCVAVLDADLSHDPADLPRIVTPVLSGQVELCVGSRYIPGGTISAWPLRRCLLSGLGTGFARTLTHVGDPLSGFFACDRSIIVGPAARELRTRGYKILLEILSRRDGLRVIEVPIRFENRRAGASKFGLRAGYDFLRQLLSLARARVLQTRRSSSRSVGTDRGVFTSPERMNRNNRKSGVAS